MKSKISYYNDGKGKFQSHEVSLMSDCDIEPETGYGETLPEAFVNFFGNVLKSSQRLDGVLSDMGNKDVDFFQPEENVLITTEERLDYYTGAKEEFPIKETIQTVSNQHTKQYKEKIEKMKEDISKITYTRPSRKEEVLSLIDMLNDNLLMLPSIVVIRSVPRIQLTWRHPNNDRLSLICNINQYGIAYVYIRTDENNTIELSGSYDKIIIIKEMLKLLHMYEI